MWNSRRARGLIAVAILLFLILQGGLLVYMGWSQRNHDRSVAERLAVLAQVALDQKNPAVLTAALEIAAKELRAEAALVCAREAYPCGVGPKFGYRVWDVPLGKEYGVVLQTPRLPEALFFYLSILSSLLVSAGAFYGLWRQGEARTRRAVADAVLSQNAQVAHDIQSPLSALLTASRDLDGVSESTRSLIQQACARTAEIARGLLETNRRYQRGDFDPLAASEEKRIPVRIASGLLSLVNEKRKEHQARAGLVIVSEIAAEAETAEALIRPQGFYRALSNLINNAAESVDGAGGRVGIRVTRDGQLLRIEVSDNGKGMAPEVLRRVLAGGGSYGKPGGMGLGVESARREIEASGGKLEIRSTLGQGTTVEIRFPLA